MSDLRLQQDFAKQGLLTPEELASLHRTEAAKGIPLSMPPSPSATPTPTPTSTPTPKATLGSEPREIEGWVIDPKWTYAQVNYPADFFNANLQHPEIKRLRQEYPLQDISGTYVMSQELIDELRKIEQPLVNKYRDEYFKDFEEKHNRPITPEDFPGNLEEAPAMFSLPDSIEKATNNLKEITSGNFKTDDPNVKKTVERFKNNYLARQELSSADEATWQGLKVKYPEFAAKIEEKGIKNLGQASKELLDQVLKFEHSKPELSGDILDLEKLKDDIEKREFKAEGLKRQYLIEESSDVPEDDADKFLGKEHIASLQKLFGVANKDNPNGMTWEAFKYDGKPLFYSEMLKDIAMRAHQNSAAQKDYPYYPGQRIAQLSPEEETAYKVLTKNLIHPEYKDTFDKTLTSLQGLQDRSVMNDLKGDGTASAAEKITADKLDSYVNPKTTKILDIIKERSKRNLEENILPKVRAPFISSGSWNMGGRSDAENRAMRDWQKNLEDTETEFLHSAYDKAESTASKDKERYLNFMLNKASLEEKEIGRQADVAEDISKLTDTYHKNKLLDTTALQGIGEQKRKQEQDALDLQYQEFANQINFPLKKIEIENQLLHQLPVSGFTGANTISRPEKDSRVSPYQPLAGMVGQMYAANQLAQQNKASGGMIENHAAGNMVGNMRDEYLSQLMNRANSVNSRKADPMLSYLMGISSGLASSTNPDVAQSLGQASNMGMNSFMNTYNQNNELEDKGLEFRKSIIDYLDKQEDRKLNTDYYAASTRKMNAEANRLNGAGGTKIDLSGLEAQGGKFKDIASLIKAGIPAKDAIRFTGGTTKSPLTRAEQMADSKKIKEVETEADMSSTEERYLEDLKRAYEKFDNATGAFTKSGTLLSKAIEDPNGVFKGLVNLYPKEAQDALAEINKVNSLIFQNRTSRPGSPKTIPYLEMVKKGLPAVGVPSDARRSLIETKEREGFNNKLHARFLNEWKKINGSTIGGDDAYREMIETFPLVNEKKDEKGNVVSSTVNKALYKKVPEIAIKLSEVYAQEGVPVNMESTEAEDALEDKEEREFNPADYMNVPDEALHERLNLIEGKR